MIIPHANKKDLKELPKEVTNNITIHCVRWIDEVLDLALDSRHAKPTIKKDKSQPVVSKKSKNNTSAVNKHSD